MMHARSTVGVQKLHPEKCLQAPGDSNFEGHYEARTSNEPGIRDPHLEVLRLELLS